MPKRISEIDRAIGINLRELRQSCGLTQSALAGELGITFQQFQKYEKGENRLPAARLYLLARMFDVPCDYFFSGLQNRPETGLPALPENPAILLRFQRLCALTNTELRDKIIAVFDILMP